MVKLNYKITPKVMIWTIISIVLLIALFFYWLHGKFFPSTDNAYVQANVVQIAPQITGKLLKLHIVNFETVKKNQPLLDIDPASFQIAVDQANAQVDLAQQKIAGATQSIQAAQELVNQRDAELILAQKNYQRTTTLVQKKYMALSEQDKVLSNLKVAENSLAAAKSKLQQELSELGKLGSENAQLRSAKAQLADAELDLKRTHIVSPVNGYVVNLTVREGTIVETNRVLFSVIDDSVWWVEANFKETDLKRIKVGQTAKIVVDIYPEHPFHGIVESISRGSGTAFSIFPAENATGNWVKVTQRFSVRIRITDPHPDYPLRVGASADVVVNTLS